MLYLNVEGILFTCNKNSGFKIDIIKHFSSDGDLCNKGHGMCYPVWDVAYKRTLVANWKE